MPSSHRPDIPGVIAPPPLIYIGFLLLGWAIFRFAATPEIVGPEMAGWLGLGFGMETQTRRIVSLPLIVGGLLLDGAAAGARCAVRERRSVQRGAACPTATISPASIRPARRS